MAIYIYSTRSISKFDIISCYVDKKIHGSSTFKYDVFFGLDKI